MTPTPTPATERELRLACMPIQSLEVRESQGGNGTWTLEGYAAVYEQETTLYDGRFLRMREVITRGAFGPVLARGADVHLNIGHDMTRAIARTGVQGPGRLELQEDETGLRMWARLDPTDPDVQALVPKMRNGIVDQASFAFTVARDRVTVAEDGAKEDELRRIDEIGELYDVTVVARGAYPQTTSQIRAALSALTCRSGIDLEGTMREAAPDSPVDSRTVIAPADPVGEDPKPNRLLVARARARASLTLMENR